MNLLTNILEINAHGGPSVPKMAADGYRASPTRGGRFVVDVIEPHVSSRYKYNSGIAWGSEMKLEGHIVKIKVNGKWIRLTEVNSEWKKFDKEQFLAKELIILDYKKYGYKAFQPNGFLTISDICLLNALEI